MHCHPQDYTPCDGQYTWMDDHQEGHSHLRLATYDALSNYIFLLTYLLTYLKVNVKVKPR